MIPPIALPTHFLPPVGINSIDSPVEVKRSELYAALRDNFYAQVPFSINAETFDVAVKSFFAFLELPEEFKMSLKCKIAPKHRRGELGLQRRQPEDGAYSDKKEFFHYHPELKKNCASAIEEHPAAREFFNYADQIWMAGASKAKELVGYLDHYFPGVYQQIFDEHHQPHLVLRFLRYECDGMQENLAKAHFDAGSCTLALAESSPGLRIGSCHDNLKLVEHRSDQALFMLARNFSTLAHSKDLLPGWHDVIRVPSSSAPTDLPCARWAVVLFIEGHSVEAPSRAETHPWQNDGTPLQVVNRS